LIDQAGYIGVEIARVMKRIHDVLTDPVFS
jgi:hypothetical protein